MPQRRSLNNSKTRMPQHQQSQMPQHRNIHYEQQQVSYDSAPQSVAPQHIQQQVFPASTLTYAAAPQNEQQQVFPRSSPSSHLYEQQQISIPINCPIRMRIKEQTC